MSIMNCYRHATGPPIAPKARDTSNYRFVRQIALKTLLSWKAVLIISISDISLFVLYYRLYFIYIIIFLIFTLESRSQFSQPGGCNNFTS